MPSPLGHALAGATAGCAILAAVPAAYAGPLSRIASMFAVLGMAPDLDLLVGAHSGPTHGIGSAAIVGLAAGVVSRRAWVGLATACAYASHILLDWLGSDSSPPIGIMALWPASRDYFESNLHVFHAISRRYWVSGFLEHNLRAIAREVVVLSPPAVLVLLAARRRRPLSPRRRGGRDQYR